MFHKKLRVFRQKLKYSSLKSKQKQQKEILGGGTAVPMLKDETDMKTYETHRDRVRLIQFLMALTDEYEPV